MISAFWGVDGCRGGWFAVNSRKGSLFGSLEDLMHGQRGASLILIDIPIGLPEEQPRRCDAEARNLLKPFRHSSVFPVPCRAAVYASGYAEACAINRAHMGKGFPIQTWHILPKVREVDSWLRAHPEWKGRLRECHPELAFASLNSGKPMFHVKRSKEGQMARLALLQKHWPESEAIYRRALEEYPRKLLAPDDILDALALALLASRPRERTSLPAQPEWDGVGIRMEIVK